MADLLINPSLRFDKGDDQAADFPDVLSLSRSEKSSHVYVEGENSYIVLKVQGRSFVDANGMHWKPAALNKRFSRAAAFQPGSDHRILGKHDLPDQVLNFAKHVYSGCFDYRALGESIYQEAEQAVSGSSRFKGLVKVFTAAGQNMVENTFKHVNEVQHGVASYSDQECETRVSISCLDRNYSTDVRHQLSVPPTPHIWVWHRLNELSFTVFGRKIFSFRRPQEGLPAEPLLGFNSYRFEVLKAPREIALKLCVEFKLPASSTFRWPINRGFIHFERVTMLHVSIAQAERLENVEILVDSSEAPDASSRPSVEIELLEEETETGKTDSTPEEVTKHDEDIATSVDVATLEGEKVCSEKDSLVVVDREGKEDETVSAKLDLEAEKEEATSSKVSAKRGREELGAYFGAARKRVMASNAQYSARALQVVDKVASRDEKRCLNESIAEVALERPSAKDFSRKVALHYNARALANTANHGALSSSSKDLPNLLSIEGASRALLSKARALQSTGRKVRGKQKNKSKPATYPLTVDDLVSRDITFVEAGKYFASMKKSWTPTTCSAGKGFRIPPKDVKGCTRDKKAIIHGLRIIFARHNLLSIDYVEAEEGSGGTFHPTYVEGGRSLRFHMKQNPATIPSKTSSPSDVAYTIV